MNAKKHELKSWKKENMVLSTMSRVQWWVDEK